MIKEEEGAERVKRKGKVKREEDKEEENADLIKHVEELILEGELQSLKVSELRQYLAAHGLNDKGKKDILVDRIFTYLEEKSKI